MIDNKLTKSEEYETHYKKLGERSRSLANIIPGKINLNAKAGESYLLNPLVYLLVTNQLAPLVVITLYY